MICQWFGTLTAQQSSKESFCRRLIAMRLDQNVDHVAVLIHGTPDILLLAVDSHEDLVHVPMVTQSSLVSLQFPHSQRRTSDTAVGWSHTTQGFPLGQEIFDISKAQAEAMVGPNRITDDLGSETIAGVPRIDGSSRHQFQFSRWN
jgi:hypothetical protein